MGLTALIVIIGIGVLTYYMMKKSMNNKITRFIFASYVAVLCLAFGMYEVSLSKKIGQLEQKDEGYAREKIHAILNHIYSDNLAEIDESYVYARKEIPFSHDELNIQLQIGESDSFDGHIVVKKKSENDGVIDLTYYRTNFQVFGIDVSDEIEPIQISWEKNTLILKPHKKKKYAFTMYENEFPLTQFDSKREELEAGFIGGVIGTEVIYLSIPKDLKVIEEANGMYINMVDEK